jgi:hypothetical protein
MPLEGSADRDLEAAGPSAAGLRYTHAIGDDD